MKENSMKENKSTNELNTKKVQGRRKVRYKSLDELFAEAIQFSTRDVKELGNWSQGQIYQHLAESLDMSIDGADFLMPAPMRWVLTLLMKRKFLTKEIPAGYQTPATFVPAETSTEQGLESLRVAIERQSQESTRAIHPGFGKITNNEWNDFHLRHAELHMSFLVLEPS